MGFLKHLLLGNIGQTLDIVETQKSTEAIGADVSRQSGRVHVLEQEVAALRSHLEKQNLALAALTRHLIEKELVKRDELERFLDELDATDGSKDGRLKLPPAGPRTFQVARPPTNLPRGQPRPKPF